jgi:hypothetical protein
MRSDHVEEHCMPSLPRIRLPTVRGMIRYAA